MVISKILSSKKTYHILLGLNFLISIIVFCCFQGTLHYDADQYLNLAKGILHGNYSMWYFLGDNIPDTFRPFGYPLYLIPFVALSNSHLPIKLVNLVLYFLSVIMSLKILSRFCASFQIRNIFLLALLPNVQLPLYSTIVLTEPLMIFLIILYLFLEFNFSRSLIHSFLMGMLMGYIALVRPVFLFFPLVKVIFNFCLVRKKKKNFRFSVMILLGALLLLTPYGILNKINHGVFRLSPIEGTGMFHMGYWQLRIPGYRAMQLYQNYVTPEIFSFYSPAEVKENVKAYEADWDYIKRVTDPWLQDSDRIKLAKMDKYNENHLFLFKTYNTKYTLAREKAFRQLTLKHILRTPVYYFLSRIYAATRLWVTGINKEKLARVNSFSGYVKIFYPTIITFITFILGLIFVSVQLIRNKILFKQCYTMVILIFYYWLIQVPFVIASRYTIPVHLVVLILLALVIQTSFSTLNQKEISRSKLQQ